MERIARDLLGVETSRGKGAAQLGVLGPVAHAYSIAAQFLYDPVVDVIWPDHRYMNADGSAGRGEPVPAGS